MPTLSPGKRAGCEDFPTLLQEENCYGSNQWLGSCWSICAPSVPQKPLLGAVRGSHASFQASLALRACIWCSVEVFSILAGCAELHLFTGLKAPSQVLRLPVWPGEGSNEIPVRMPFTFPALGAAGFCWRGRFAVVSKWNKSRLVSVVLSIRAVCAKCAVKWRALPGETQKPCLC